MSTPTPSIETDELVQHLLDQIKSHISTPGSTDIASNLGIEETITKLSSTQTSNATMDPKFDDLFGYYNVSCTLTTRPKENPVGGKWTRRSRINFWVIRRTLQHILPRRPGGLVNAVAQAVNIIQLDLLFGAMPVWIVLRGDVVPLINDVENTIDEEKGTGRTRRRRQSPPLLPQLSSRAVRAYFDRPRIAFGRWTFSFGPTSSVVLDTPYVDSRIRIGKGGTSGTLFVFSRVAEEDAEAMTGWEWLVDQDASKFVTQRSAALASVIYGVTSGLATQVLEGMYRKVAWGNLALSVIGLLWVAFATGGIETRGGTFARGK